ncbi:MAG: hypothetical protein M3Y87_27055 [Myxococcota bacterium]|nr:hypothetical protein [Myxococcota bacterium]
MLDHERDDGDLRAHGSADAFDPDAVRRRGIGAPTARTRVCSLVAERSYRATDEGRELRHGIARLRRSYAWRSRPAGIASELARLWRDRALRAESSLTEARAVLEHHLALRRV